MIYLSFFLGKTNFRVIDTYEKEHILKILQYSNIKGVSGGIGFAGPGPGNQSINKGIIFTHIESLIFLFTHFLWSIR